MQAIAYYRKQSTHEWRGRVYEGPIVGTWSHASDSVNQLMLILQLALQVSKHCRANTEETELD